MGFSQQCILPIHMNSKPKPYRCTGPKLEYLGKEEYKVEKRLESVEGIITYNYFSPSLSFLPSHLYHLISYPLLLSLPSLTLHPPPSLPPTFSLTSYHPLFFLPTPSSSSSSSVRFSAPSTPVLLSSSQDSLTFSLTLPNEGTPPILHLIVNFTSPNHFQWSCIGARSLGEELPCTVPRLSPNTAYTLTVYAMGYAGVGNASSQVTFSTGEQQDSYI